MSGGHPGREFQFEKRGQGQNVKPFALDSHGCRVWKRDRLGQTVARNSPAIKTSIGTSFSVSRSPLLPSNFST